MKRLAASLRTKLLAGVAVIVPIVVTILALRFVFRTLDAFLGETLASLLGREIPGLGLLATLALVLFVGIVATNWLGRRMLTTVDRLFEAVPLVRRIYGATKDIVASATLSRRQVFRAVVMVEYPRAGLHSYGFVTGYTTRTTESGARALANVFIPGPPVPTTGVLVAVPVDELFYLDLSIEDALKLILSAGMATPPELNERADPPS